MRQMQTGREVLNLELDFATVEQIRWLREHGRYGSDEEVVRVAVQTLSRDMEKKEDERRHREELARQTRYRSHDLG